MDTPNPPPHAPELTLVEPCNSERIEDGGGHVSSADWLSPQETADLLKPLRKRWLDKIKEWGLRERLQGGFQKGDEGLLSAEKVDILRKDLQSFLAYKGLHKRVSIDPGQPSLIMKEPLTVNRKLCMCDVHENLRCSRSSQLERRGATSAPKPTLSSQAPSYTGL